MRESKTDEGEGRIIAIPDSLLEEFMAHMGGFTTTTHPKDYVFHHPTIGSKWGQEYYRRAFKAAVESAGLESPRE